ncbi:MAG: hypothetical protein D6798_03240 [Deltaproteobacteria bacterium]|nr:MAG: hypothetical protein D6798_03240 [Deltaproteobacteria bacterium]
MSWDVWGPPLVVVLTGLVAGLLVALRSRPRDAAPGPSGGLSVEDLLARKESLVEQLRSLEADRDKMEPAEFEARWRHTLDRAAEALRDLEAARAAAERVAPPAAAEAGDGPPEPSAAPAPPPSGGGAMARRVGWTAAVVVFFVLLGVTLTKSTSSRPEGGSMTGGPTMGGSSESSSVIAEAEARLAADPTDVDAAAILAHDAIRQGRLDAGMQYVDAGRKVAPDDPRIQSSLAALMIAIGYLDRAEATLDQAQAADPDLPTAWLWRGVLAMQRQDPDAARAAFEKVLELSTDATDRRLAASLLHELSAPPPAVRVTGTVTLADGVTVPPDALVFITARSSQVPAGPPLAALRRSAAELPLEFTLSDSDMVMGGGTWPDTVWLQARVDLDGNAMTREEGAPETEVVGPITADSGPVTLTLQGSVARQ